MTFFLKTGADKNNFEIDFLDYIALRVKDLGISILGRFPHLSFGQKRYKILGLGFTVMAILLIMMF
ncbi:hypothetical protein [Maribacter sp. 2304DJ31-5]|uniref:hypothetical protein n=1 Tax=Maribacter sp. 2304DJ31-5 TaxID=3386273 RepID=UPI0039BD2BC5